jgi:aspartyl aminopeptidase
LTEFLAAELGVTADQVAGWELMTHDLAPSRLVVRESDLLSAPRMDNQVICHAGTHALWQAATRPTP